MRAMTPAVKRALKAADEVTSRFIREFTPTAAKWCLACNSPDAVNGAPIMHRHTCPVGRYLAARKEIADDV